MVLLVYQKLAIALEVFVVYIGGNSGFDSDCCSFNCDLEPPCMAGLHWYGMVGHPLAVDLLREQVACLIL